MQLNDPLESSSATMAPSGAHSSPPDAATPPVHPITELLLRPDFPLGALGEQVEIGGNSGTIIEIVRHSIRVRSAEGVTMGYNVNVLRKLYGPPPVAEVESAPPVEVAPPAPPAPRRDFIADPDFTAPLKLIESIVNRQDFPKCAYGQHLDLHGFEGVVVEIVNHSLKIRSQQGSTRSYNADGLVRLYGKGPSAR